MSTKAMESNSGNSGQNQNLNPLGMVLDSGGSSVALPCEGDSSSVEGSRGDLSSVIRYRTQVACGPDLIASALAAQEARLDPREVGMAQEGIIFRNPAITTASAANSKMHFISNLTLIAKQQQPSPRAPQNIIFLSNAANQSSATTGKVPATSTAACVSAFVSKGVATTATGKVVNLLHSGAKAPSSVLTQQQRAKGLHVLKRPLSSQQRHLNVVGRSAGPPSQAAAAGGATQAPLKSQNIVLTGNVKALGKGKLITTGLYNANSAAMKVVTSISADPQKPGSARYARGSNVLANAPVPKPKPVVSKYQPKVVQVQHPHPQSPSRGVDGVVHQTSYTAIGGAQWRVDVCDPEERGRSLGSEPDATDRELPLQCKVGVTELARVVPAHQSGSRSRPLPPQSMLIPCSNGGAAAQATGKVVMGARSNAVKLASLATSQFSVIGDHQQTPAATGPEGRGCGTIKYVNSQGNVVQQLQTPGPSVGPKYRHSAHIGGYQEGGGSEAAAGHHVIQFGADKKAEEVYYVNGTQINDEMSARLLQNFSLKATSRFAAQCSVGGPKYQYSAPSSASQRVGPEYIRVNTSDILATPAAPAEGPSPMTRPEDSRPAPTRSPPDGNNNSGWVDGFESVPGYPGAARRRDDSLGVEMRPVPIASTDRRATALHAVMQDHTYVLLRSGEPKVGGPSYLGASAAGTPFAQSHLQRTSLDHKELAVAMALADVGGRPARPPQPMQCTTTDLLNAAMGLGHYSLSASHLDDDNCSVISSDSRSGRVGENDLGEETETAPEGDGEDDSVTRCICDLTHDDGYMICCDKCSTWQHVDCMGIDRMNIPDEYKCEVCCPRPMDKNRARTLQLLKRREQQNAVLMHSMAFAPGASPFMGTAMPGPGHVSAVPFPSDGRGHPGEREAIGRKLGGLSPGKKPKSHLGARRKSELGAAFSLKKQKRDLLKNGAGKRKEKRVLSKKRTTSGIAGLPSAKHATGAGVPLVATEERPGPKPWADNYETAMTNHYSPELRARLQAISKHHQSQLLLSPTGTAPANLHLRNVADLSNKCTTVPHAGGKILISTLDVAPGEPIVELRGKYMLSGQFRQSAGANRSQAGKPGGPFIFFYRLANDATELCVDTRTYGNDARFVRRSCRPNAEIVHHLEKGTIHLYVVSLQPIRSSTEITIKHEPHDQLAAARVSAGAGMGEGQPTSTSCACGLVKDCLFYDACASSLAESLRQGKRPNGHPQKMRTTSASRAGEETAGPLRRSSKANFRSSRSTSSSGESSASLMSPNVSAGSLGLIASPMSPKTANEDLRARPECHGVELVMKKEEALVEPQLPWTSSPDTPKATIKQEADAYSLLPNPQAIPVEEPVVVKEEAQQVEAALPIKKEGDKSVECTVEGGGAVVAEESLLKSPDTLTTYKKNKELKSLNEENLKAVCASARGACEESRKLTREERKMEAIMKAFEKMEKSSMRKQEGRKSGSNLGLDISSKRRNSMSYRKDGDEASIFKKKKRKGSKSYQHASQRRIRRKSSTISPEDTFTSEESTGSLLASPPISVPFTYPTPPQPLPHTEALRFTGEQNSAANMLLSLANAAPAGEGVSTPKGDSTSPLSSVYMLVEAAIAPLEAAADFKVPKTKKSIMNDWLTADKAEDKGGQQNRDTQQPFESLLLAACGQAPENLCTKVEEFIMHSGGQGANSDISDARGSAQPPFPAPPLTGGSESAVKKRWLRQAISEECSDEAPASPTNGYAATPLKKRRFARQCSEETGPLFPKHSDTLSSTSSFAEFKSDLLMGTEGSAKDSAAATESTNGGVEEVLAVVPSHVERVPAYEGALECVPEQDSPSETVRPSEVADAESTGDKATGESTAALEDLSSSCSVAGVPVKAETVSGPATVEEPKVIIPEEFDIEPLNPEDKSPAPVQLEHSAKSAGSAEDVNDEIADIQKRLHSFHAENILFLKSMNKKTKPNPSPQNSECPSAYSSASVSASSSSTSSPTGSPKSSMSGTRPPQSSYSFGGKRKKLDFDAEELTKDADELGRLELGSPAKRTARRTKSRFSSPLPADFELKDLNSNTVGVAKEAAHSEPMADGDNTGRPSCASPPTETHSYYTSAATSFAGGAGHHHSMTSSQVNLINTSIPPPHMSYPTMFNAFSVSTEDVLRADTTSTMGVQASSRLLLSELLENAQKISSHPLAEMPQPSTAYPPAPPIVSGSSGCLALSATATHSKMTFHADVLLGGASATLNVPSTSRSLIRTGSADPRLNPHLNALPETPPAPKRKLSINEYRKRMLQTPVSGNDSNSSSATASPTGFTSREGLPGDRFTGGDGSDHPLETSVVAPAEEGAESHPDPILDSLCDSNSCGSPPICEGADQSEKGTFSAAPTLLERQQESISERLKSYKSVTELLTTKDGAPIITTILQNNPLGTSIIESLRNSIGPVEDGDRGRSDERDSAGADGELERAEPVTYAAAAR